ncbi:MAG TPA: NAD(P)-binding domain-containing protein [Kofleriaceae bacterium]|nr:NAD(P)-binding domain-containing protein [Kofleriaceae bacterium]
MTRGAPRLVATSDVTRFRGIAIAAIVAGLVAAMATVVLWPRGSAPGPLSTSHQGARLACATCHTRGTDEPPPSTACAGCHGKHATARPGHAALRKDGSLGCTSCHGGHRSHGSVTFFPDGTTQVSRPDTPRPMGSSPRTVTQMGDTGDRAPQPGAGAGGRRTHLGNDSGNHPPGVDLSGSPRSAASGAFRPSVAITVPLLDATKCARCHDATRAPLTSCSTNGIVTCFDEHAPIRATDGALAVRAAAWDAARAVASTTPPRPRPARRDAPPWLVLALAAAAALVAWAASRTLAARRESAALARSSARRHPVPASRFRSGSETETETETGTGTRSATAAAPAAIARRLPVIDRATCLGCNACVEACPYDVLEVRRYVAVVARPDACCGLTLCAQICPNQSLVMRDIAAPAAAVPVMRTGLESPDAPGLFLVGDAGGGSLIRNAVDEGARAVVAIAARARPAVTDADLHDVVIIGAGPAGLAAALEARARNLRALTLEQGTIASSIQSFPRGKLVLDAAPPAATPPRLWLAEATKEELLARWSLTIRTEQPPLLEHRRVTALERVSDGTWRITSTDARALDGAGTAITHRARTVVLAVGRRGSPRRLPLDIPPAMTAHVHYALADAASFAGRRVVIVGAGDVAMETAIALSRQPGTEVVLSYRGADLRRGRARNIAELRRRIAAGAVRAHWSSELTALAPGTATLTTPAGPIPVGCDSLFVLIGTEASHLTHTWRAAQTEPPHHAFDTR